MKSFIFHFFLWKKKKKSIPKLRSDKLRKPIVYSDSSFKWLFQNPFYRPQLSSMGLLRQRRTGSHFLFEKSGPFIKSNWRPPSMYSFFSPPKKETWISCCHFSSFLLATTRSRAPRIVDNNMYLSVCAGSQRQHDIYSTHLRTPADRIVCAKQDNRAQKSEEWSSFSLEPICFGCQTLGLVYIRWAKVRARWRKRKTVPYKKRINGKRKERTQMCERDRTYHSLSEPFQLSPMPT